MHRGPEEREGEGEGLTGAATGAGGTGVLRQGRKKEGGVRGERKVQWSWFGCNSTPSPCPAASLAKPPLPKPTEGNCSKRIAAALPLLGLKLLPMRLKGTDTGGMLVRPPVSFFSYYCSYYCSDYPHLEAEW